MIKHMKRQMVPKNWPIPRKGTKYVVAPTNGDVPILVILRDMIKVANNRKEVKKAIHEKSILLNNKIVVDEKKGATLYDTVTIVPAKKSYRLVLTSNGKFKMEEVKDGINKIAKVVNKKVLKGKKVQINLSDGRNYLSDVKCHTNDSVVVDFAKGVTICLPLKEKAKVVVFAGKHAGKQGVIEKIIEERKMTKIKVGDESINVLIKQMMVVE